MRKYRKYVRVEVLTFYDGSRKQREERYKKDG